MKKAIYKVLGILSLVLGGFGVILPVLPTTPFLLLSAWLFLRSSKTMYHWLMNHPVFGIYIKSYTKYKGIRKDHKIFALITLWTSIILSIVHIKSTQLRVILIVIASLVTLHIISFKTLTKRDIEEIETIEEKAQLIHQKQ